MKTKMDTDAARTVRGAPVELADELADAAHELKTPIAIALALCASAIEAHDAASLRDDVRRIESHVRSLRDQLEALLDADRLAAPRGMRTGSADLTEIVRDATETYGAVAARRRVSVGVEPAEPVPAVVDAERLGIAVRNLVANAVRHAPDGGVVRTAVVRDGGWARIEVADDGPGVPAEHRESVFERFRRLERDARRHLGSGLGLAIVRDVAAEHGGRVEVGDAPEGGALFAMELPLAQGQRPAFGRHLRALERAPLSLPAR